MEKNSIIISSMQAMLTGNVANKIKTLLKKGYSFSFNFTRY